MRDCTQNTSQQVSGEMETRFEVLMAPKNVAPEHCKKTHHVAGFSLEFEPVDDGASSKGYKIASWSARMVANAIGVKKPPWMEMDQWWRLWHRTRHRWIKKCNMNVLTVVRERVLCWAEPVARLDDKEICAKALRCRGLQWWRWGQLHWKEVEKEKWSRPHPKRFKIYRWKDMVSAEVSKVCGNADGFAESVQQSGVD